MADGLMAQALANVRRAETELAAVTGLPPAAVPVQASMVATLETMAPRVHEAASAVLDAAGKAVPQMDAADAAVEAGDPGATEQALDALQGLMAASASAVRGALTEVQRALDAIHADHQRLADVGTDVAGRITRAQAEADAARGAADDLESKKYYWLLLGPFGLVGLSVCIGMIVTATQKVNTLRQQVSELRGQSSQWTKVQADLDLLRHDVPGLTYLLLSLQSSLDFLASDTAEVVADVGKAAGSPIARAYLIAARHQLAALGTDAS